MAAITRNGEKWRVQINIKGVRDSATFETKAKAVAWAAQRETELRTQGQTGVLAGKTCAEAFDRYLREVSVTKRGQRWEVLRLNALKKSVVNGKIFGELALTDLTPEFIGKWRDMRLQTVKGSTVNRDLNLLSNVLTMARREWRWIAHAPTKDVRRPKDPQPRDRRITSDEIERIKLACMFDESPPTMRSQFVAIAFLFAIETAMRAGEICALKPEWINGRVIHLPASANKNGIKRDVPLSTRAMQLLSLLPQDTLFGFTASALDGMFRKCRNKANITDMTFHDTRHEAITRLAEKLDVMALARMVGHTDIKMLMRYYNKSAADIAASLD